MWRWIFGPLSRMVWAPTEKNPFNRKNRHSLTYIPHRVKGPKIYRFTKKNSKATGSVKYQVAIKKLTLTQSKVTFSIRVEVAMIVTIGRRYTHLVPLWGSHSLDGRKSWRWRRSVAYAGYLTRPANVKRNLWFGCQKMKRRGLKNLAR